MCRASRPLLKADAAVVCDTEMFAPGLPTICVGLRGLVYTELEVQGAGHDLHSGIYGGAAPNPIQAIAEILCALKDRDGHILIPGLYDRVRPPSPEERAAWARLPFNEEEYKRKEMEASELVGEPEVPVFERTWARPTLEVHGIRGGFTGEGAKTVIPARATAKLSMRLVADQKPDEALEQLKRAVAKACPKGVTAKVKPIQRRGAVAGRSHQPVRHAPAAEAMSQVFGKETVFIRSGGSIPIVGLFDKSLGIPSVLMGFGLPDDNLHAPNEKFHLPNFYRGIEAVAQVHGTPLTGDSTKLPHFADRGVRRFRRTTGRAGAQIPAQRPTDAVHELVVAQWESAPRGFPNPFFDGGVPQADAQGLPPVLARELPSPRFQIQKSVQPVLPAVGRRR